MASFVLRRIDDALWARFRARAEAEGITTKDLLLRLIAAYVNAPAAPKGTA
jgi:hypothetical protein